LTNRQDEAAKAPSTIIGLQSGDNVVALVPSSSDDTFMLKVYVSVRSEEMQAWGWDEAQAAAFCYMQYELQQRSYRMSYPSAELYKVTFAGEEAGKLHVAEGEDALTIVDIALLPAYRRRGIGSALIKQLQHQARRTGRSVRLTVRAGNPAAGLYARLGFRECESDEVNISMIWSASQND